MWSILMNCPVDYDDNIHVSILSTQTSFNMLRYILPTARLASKQGYIGYPTGSSKHQQYRMLENMCIDIENELIWVTH